MLTPVNSLKRFNLRDCVYTIYTVAYIERPFIHNCVYCIYTVYTVCIAERPFKCPPRYILAAIVDHRK